MTTQGYKFKWARSATTGERGWQRQGGKGFTQVGSAVTVAHDVMDHHPQRHRHL